MSQQYLILALQAPLIAYGEEAVDSRRPTDHLPGLSMLTGMLGNALGYRREEAARLDALQQSISYAARSETGHSQAWIQDFHTARLGANDRAWTTYGRAESRKGQKGGAKGLQITEIRAQDYVTETASVVALSIKEQSDVPSLEELAQAVKQPARPLFIGRKCCLPERPIFEKITEANCATEALYLTPSITGEEEGQAQWDGDRKHESVELTHQLWVSDLKDWSNNTHTGRRLVNRGRQTLRVITQGEEDTKSHG